MIFVRNTTQLSFCSIAAQFLRKSSPEGQNIAARGETFQYFKRLLLLRSASPARPQQIYTTTANIKNEIWKLSPRFPGQKTALVVHDERASSALRSSPVADNLFEILTRRAVKLLIFSLYVKTSMFIFNSCGNVSRCRISCRLISHDDGRQDARPGRVSVCDFSPAKRKCKILPGSEWNRFRVNTGDVFRFFHFFYSFFGGRSRTVLHNLTVRWLDAKLFSELLRQCSCTSYHRKYFVSKVH